MGRAKALIPHGQASQGEFLCRILQQFAQKPPLLLGHGPFANTTLTRVADRIANAGPLSGLLGLFDYQLQDYLVLAVDHFAMNEAALQWLFSEAEQNKHAAVVMPRFPENDCGEPLAAFYRKRAVPFLEAHWRSGARNLKHAIPISNKHEPLIPKTHRTAFLNANTAEELQDLLTKGAK